LSSASAPTKRFEISRMTSNGTTGALA
jgi:hypothetical protein